jgi:ribosome maturation factor RimP
LFMDSAQVAQRVQEVAAPILWAMGLELIDVTCSGQGQRTIVRVYIDKPGGVSLRDCEQAHSSLGPALDVADPIPHAYTLEVSSPGLDRPLKKLADYQRVVGRLVNLKLAQAREGQWRVIGRLTAADEQGVSLTLREGKIDRSVQLGWDAIAGGRLEVEFSK